MSDAPKITVARPNLPTNSEPGMDAESFEATKRLVQNLSVKLDELKAKQKEFRERLKNLQVNDALLSEYEEQAKAAASEFTKRKKELMASVEAQEVQAKLKETNEELKDIQDSLTNHLLNYFQVTRTQSFETPTGQEREFRLNAKLLPVKEF